MTDLTVQINFSIGVGGLTLSLLGVLMCFFIRPIDRTTRRYFVALFTLLTAYSAAIMLSYLAEIVGDAPGMRCGIFLSSLFSSMLMPVLTLYMLFLTGENWKRSALFRAVAAAWCVYFALLLSTLFTGHIYAIDDAGVYSRGPLYLLLLIPPVLSMAMNLTGLWRRWDKLPSQRASLLTYMAVPLAGMIVQIFYFGILATAIGTIIGTAAMFVFMLQYQVKHYVRQAEDSAEKEFGLKVLQMRPHFIYNAMTSIYYLVDTDPEKAKSAIRDFSLYLHQNFSAVVKTGEIPFEEELTHTRAYLAVEQARFAERLEVTFDTPHTSFRLAPLTLEPLVENAVKHGMDPECDPLRITIRTRALEDGSEITVENTGADFHPGSEQVGLSSVRERLKHMGGGSLTILPRTDENGVPCGGAVVRMWIPKRAADQTGG